LWISVQWQPYTICGHKWISTRIFQISWLIWVKFDTKDLDIMPFSKCDFKKSVKWKLYFTFHWPVPHSYPICVKFGMRAQHTLLLSVCQFHENPWRGGCTFLIGKNKISPIFSTFTHVLINRRILEGNKPFVKSVYYITEYTTCNLINNSYCLTMLKAHGYKTYQI
jgi:hypothetical protein